MVKEKIWSSCVKILKFMLKIKIAIDEWNNNPNIDALIIWSHWAKVLGDKALFIEDEKAAVYRTAEIIPTKKDFKINKL